MKKPLLLLTLFLSANLYAQNDVENVLSDILFILDGYNQPAAEASVMQTSGGWFHTARPLGLYKVNLAVGIGGLPFPSRRKRFEVSNTDFSNLRIRGGERASIPTTIGGRGLTFFDFEIEGETYEFQAFSGLDTDFFAYPYIQSQIGLWKETELTLRYAPQVTIEKTNYAVYGASLKHGLSQYFFESDRSFELSLFVNYSLSDLNLIYDEPLDLEPTDGGAQLAIVTGSLIDFHSVNTGVVASKLYGKWTLSTAVNYNTSWVDYRLVGEEGPFFNLFNQALTRLSDRKNTFKLDLGAAYQLSNRWNLNTQISVGDFVNFNLSGVYLLN
ncbi:DUF6588 family protein [Nonlabens xiamenensis]|uniref:DUF6588 family protein n=1 Tax=Nonlabens xiamenensis TaxID=2341043 RepID=UPI000F615704|nr:DUF6588 family protein [Nonlabens xiamenensis]